MCSGQLVWAAAAGAGLSALLLALEPAFRTLKYVGCAYLLCLAALTLRDAVRSTPGGKDEQEPVRSPGAALAAVYRQGLIRCGCRVGGTSRRLGSTCPRLRLRGHGSWYFSLD
ncbi:LysE family transporter [Nocardiopsis sp. LSu2-4]|uniref:LysE family transporter n=1 Tax=Nocardiopsis suaedae TaxID=3018444 RepID=A0ABT4TM04_9ACTN|nr:LysE family transporter [Nocardiopsis suaedae]MDA2805415.1 LysE family transporter [Nocardiopsis suaedae]